MGVLKILHRFGRSRRLALQPIVERIAAAAARAVRSPELLERLRRDGVVLVGNTPEAFRALIAREISQWREVGRAAKITLE
jgi:tripartite-type tricarboxylate transporter receptor subunit TctC